MPYIENRLVHDADSHLMEMSDCLNPYFEQSLLQRFLAHPNLGVRVGNRLAIEDAQKRQQDEAFRANVAENIMLRKNYEAHGAFLETIGPLQWITSALPASLFSPHSAWAILVLTNWAIKTFATALPQRTTE